MEYNVSKRYQIMINFQVKPIVYKSDQHNHNYLNQNVGDNKATSLEPRPLEKLPFF